MALTFHADNGERVGIVCSECIKIFCPGSFGQHAKDCMDSLALSTNKVKIGREAISCGPILGGSSGSMESLGARC